MLRSLYEREITGKKIRIDRLVPLRKTNKNVYYAKNRFPALFWIFLKIWMYGGFVITTFYHGIHAIVAVLPYLVYIFRQNSLIIPLPSME